MKSNRGFSLLETLLYLAIFAIVGGALFGILTNVVRISTQEVSGGEVTSQLQFVMQTINRLVQGSSNIEISTSTAVSVLKLRMSNPTQDPTCISLVNGVLKLAQGPDQFQPQNCTTTTTDLTSNKIVVDTALFKRIEFPGGHDQVSVDLQFSNAATGPAKISRALHAGISRATAATFDSDLLPNADAQYEVGSSILGGKRWKNASFSGNLTVSGTVGIGTSGPTGKLTVAKGDYSGGLTGGIQVVGVTTPAKTIEIGLNETSNYGVINVVQSGVGGLPLELQPNGGKVGIGTSAPSSLLSVNGTADKVGGGTWGTFSDVRLKKNIRPFALGLDAIMALQPVAYQYNGVKYADDGKTYVGVVAQSVINTPLEPYTISTSSDGYYKWDSSAVTYALINAVKEQQQEIDMLKAEVAGLKK